LKQCEELRNFALDNPILIAVRRAGPDERAMALNAGADACIEIPFSEIEIRANVLALLRQRERRVKFDQRSAWIAGLPIQLTRREDAIIKALARQRGTTVSRRALLIEAFAINFDTGTNVLDVHISHLRKKLRAARAGVIIQSVRGVGYRIQFM
jgi:DNA-binding response OmpR family regulator